MKQRVLAVFGQPEYHKPDRLDDDDRRLVWTACGIRTFYDPDGYKRALAVTESAKPHGRCAKCWPQKGA